MGKAIPTLPAIDLDRTVSFYEGLGFALTFRQDKPSPYAIVAMGEVELHFFGFDLDPSQSYAGCYIRVDDVDSLHEAFKERFAALGADLPARMLPLQDRAWGMREFYVIDPNGNLLRIGQRIEDGETA